MQRTVQLWRLANPHLSRPLRTLCTLSHRSGVLQSRLAGLSGVPRPLPLLLGTFHLHEATAWGLHSARLVFCSPLLAPTPFHYSYNLVDASSLPFGLCINSSCVCVCVISVSCWALYDYRPRQAMQGGWQVCFIFQPLLREPSEVASFLHEANNAFKEQLMAASFLTANQLHFVASLRRRTHWKVVQCCVIISLSPSFPISLFHWGSTYVRFACSSRVNHV